MSARIDTLTPWQIAFRKWQAFVSETQARARAITDKRHEAGWSLAATVGIPRCGCSLHNASIDDNMTGWCKDNPTRLAVAKRAARILDDWRASRVARRMIARRWNELLSEPFGAARCDLE